MGIGGEWGVGSWQLAVGSWQLAVGSWQLAVGSWQWAVGSWQLAVGSWQLAVGGGQLAVGSGRWAVGSWQLAVGSAGCWVRKDSGGGAVDLEGPVIPVREPGYGAGVGYWAVQAMCSSIFLEI